jgi:hypothetical protein
MELSASTAVPHTMLYSVSTDPFLTVVPYLRLFNSDTTRPAPVAYV